MDRILAADAGFVRLRMAASITLTAMLSAAVLVPLARGVHQPLTTAMVGITLASMGSLGVSDRSSRAQRLTMALLPVVASASVLAEVLTAPVPWLHVVTLLVLTFVAVWVRRFGPRGLALGMVGFSAFFFAQLFRAQLAQVPWMIAAVFMASALAYGVRFWLLREPPDHGLRQMLAAFRRRIAIVFVELSGVLADGRVQAHRRRRVRRALTGVNELALALEERLGEVALPAVGLAGTAVELQVVIFVLELAVEQMAAALRALVEAGAFGAQSRRQLAEGLSAARRVMRSDDAAAYELAVRAFEGACAAATPPGEPPRRELARLRAMLVDLLEAARGLSPSASGASPWREAWATDRLDGVDVVHMAHVAHVAHVDPPPPGRPVATVRQAVQVTIAVALALLAGNAVSNARGYWAVIAAFVVFNRANTAGATVVIAWQRALGTVVGVAAGLVIAHFAAGHTYGGLAVLFASMFLFSYLLRVAPVPAIASLTAAIAALYGLLGVYSPGILYLRLLETLIGAGIGASIATLVQPVHMRLEVRAALVEMLRALAGYLAEAVAERRPDTPRLALLDTARQLDRKLQAIRDLVEPVAAAPLVRAVPGLARVLQTAWAVVFFARPLVAADAIASIGEPTGRLLREVGQRLAENARALADALESGQQRSLSPAVPLIEKGRQGLSPAEEGAHGTASPAVALGWLTRLDEELLVLDRVVHDPGLRMR